MKTEKSLAEIEREHQRIKQGKCPLCAVPVVSKGGSVRCCSCSFSITSGTWDQQAGYCIQHQEAAR